MNSGKSGCKGILEMTYKVSTCT